MSGHRNFAALGMFVLVTIGVACSALAQAPAQQRPQGGAAGAGGGAPAAQAPRVVRPPVFFREEWKNDAPGTPPHALTQANVTNANLELMFYGPAKGGHDDGLLINGVPGNENAPVHVWSGTCGAPCGATLRDKQNYVDLTGLARIRWVTHVTGFHQLRPMVKLADGTLLVGDHADGLISDWLENEFAVSDVKWLKLDSEKNIVTKGDVIAKPDLSKVDEVGFVDLMPGSGHGVGGYFQLTLFEVFGKPVPR